MTREGWEAYNRRMDPVLLFWLAVQIIFPPLFIWWWWRYGRGWR